LRRPHHDEAKEPDLMPRLPEVTDRNALPEDQRHVFDYLAETRGGVRLPFSELLNHPEAS